MKKWQLCRLAVFALVFLLLAVQPAAQLARAQDGGPAIFVIAGVAGATLRAEPNGASAALAIVPADATVTMTGPDVVTSGTVWRQVRTTEGVTGYLPAGLLVQTGGAPVQTATPAVAPASASAPSAPASSVGSAPVSVAPAQTENAAASTGEASSSDSSRSSAATRGPDPAISPTPSAPGRRTTVERRRGQDVTITHIDTERAPNGREMGAGRIVVKFKPGANQTARTDAHRVAGAHTTETLGLPDTMVANVQVGTVEQALAAYRARSDVLWAEPNYLRRATVMPNDPSFASQQWNLRKIGAPVAWDLTDGANAPKIAILDCGIWTESSSVSFTDSLKGHQDLRGKVAQLDEKNFSTALDADDWCDHGSLMAGIAAANTNNGQGVAGTAFNAALMNGKVLDDSGRGEISWLAQGIMWAADRGAGVISMSLGGEGACSQTEQAAIDYAWSKGVVLVAAAGNGGADGVGDPLPEAPGNCNHVVAVGAINRVDARASFSNYNANPSAGRVVPLAAPGVDIYSTTSYNPFYATVNGTSPATPHVAGVAALVKAANPNLTNTEIVDRLINSAAPIVGTGTFWANGRIDAPAAMSGVTCSPRPKISVIGTPMGTYLNAVLTATGAGNAIRYFQVNGVVGAMVNGSLILPSTLGGGTNVAALEWQSASTYVPAETGATVTAQITRQTAGTSTLIPIRVQDVCGSWMTFVGGGPRAGF